MFNTLLYIYKHLILLFFLCFFKHVIIYFEYTDCIQHGYNLHNTSINNVIVNIHEANTYMDYIYLLALASCFKLPFTY